MSVRRDRGQACGYAGAETDEQGPDGEAYDHVVKAIGVPAERIVFFDDLADNIAGARAYGLTAVHVTSPDDVANAFAALGI